METFRTLIITIAAITFMMVFWASVQHFWKRAFPEEYTDDDALAGRSSCGNCGCSGVCTRKNEHEAKALEN